MGLTFSYPLGLSTQEASVARAHVQMNQIDTQIKQAELQVATDVTNDATAIRNAVEAAQAAEVSVVLAQRQLDAEQSKFEVGMSTNYNVVLAQQISGNPLDAKLEVRVAKLDDVAAIDTLARRWSGVDPTDPTNYQGDFVNRMLQLSAWLGIAGVGLLAILVVVSIVIVMNTIRTAVYHRRKEIEVMKLVGATEWFVRGPFVIEGVMTGLIAASFALALLVLAYQPAVERFRADVAFIPLSYDPAFMVSLAQDLLIGGALLGALGSYIGVRRYVRI